MQNAHRASRLWRAIAKNWGLYLLIAPSFILLLFFTYFPMYGVQIAFKDYNLMAGITRSPWADPWYKYFQRFFNSYQSELVIKNTLLLGLYSIAAGYPIPILLGLLINQMRPGKFRRVYQTVTYIPHFISTVVLVGMELEARRATAAVMDLAVHMVRMVEVLTAVRQEATDSMMIHLAVSEDLAHLVSVAIRDRMTTIRMIKIPDIFRPRRTI